MSGYSSGPARPRLLDEFAQIRAEHRARTAQIEEESRERFAKAQERSAQADREIAAYQADKAAKAKAKAEAEKDDKPDKPENPWAQPTRHPDSAARIGYWDDEDATPPTAAEAAAAPAARPVPPPAPVARPVPVTEPEPEPVRPRRWQADDEDDFSGGSFLRG